MFLRLSSLLAGNASNNTLDIFFVGTDLESLTAGVCARVLGSWSWWMCVCVEEKQVCSYHSPRWSCVMWETAVACYVTWWSCALPEEHPEHIPGHKRYALNSVHDYSQCFRVNLNPTMKILHYYNIQALCALHYMITSAYQDVSDSDGSLFIFVL